MAVVNTIIATVDHDEIARFDNLAKQWWDSDGPMRALHRRNPVRLAYIRDRICWHFGSDPLTTKPLAGLRVLDMGCGAGLLSEPLRRLGADVVGVDAASEVIDVARHHAETVELDIDYRQITAEELADAGERFDAVVAMEILEHVSDTGAFVNALGRMLSPQGILVAATLNRTLKSFALAIVGAEWILGWLPRGTHQWDKFLRPSEVARELRGAGFDVGDVTGVSFDATTGGWHTSTDTGVNYLLFATKP
jgi:2-polyprenyl-6-hydroxyphenyl methylase/3-demethylubiquinone-9 3-methyltransferase